MFIIIVRDNENNRWKTEKAKNKKRQKNKEDGNYSERGRVKWLCCAFKLSFLQLISKASLNFQVELNKLNLELALSIILKERELQESKHVAVECRCLKYVLQSWFKNGDKFCQYR